MSSLLWEDYVSYLENDEAELYEEVAKSAVTVAGGQYGAWPLWTIYLELLGRRGQLAEQERTFQAILRIPMRYRHLTSHPSVILYSSQAGRVIRTPKKALKKLKIKQEHECP